MHDNKSSTVFKCRHIVDVEKRRECTGNFTLQKDGKSIINFPDYRGDPGRGLLERIVPETYFDINIESRTNYNILCSFSVHMRWSQLNIKFSSQFKGGSVP